MSGDISQVAVRRRLWNATTFEEVPFRFFGVEHAIPAASAGCGIAVLHFMEESTLAALRVKYSSMLKPQSIGCCVQKLDDTTLVEKDYFQSIMHLQYFI